ncbi:RHS repeat domain-containing protein [Bacteroides rodentium]
MVYENGVRKLLLTEEGYVTLSDSKYHYYLKDHQGNNRVVINQSGSVEETNHYYPFGGVFASTTNVQPYKYNGKEYDTKKGLGWYDYGARHYDVTLGRFTTVDPSAENYFNSSPYAYCGNSPINRIDPDGMDWYENANGDLRWQEGSETLEGYTNIGSCASIRFGEESYLNFYQNGGVKANQAVNAFDLIASDDKLQNLFLGKDSPLSEDSKSSLFNSLNSRSMDAIARPIGEAVVGLGTGELGGALLGKAVGWAAGKVAGKVASRAEISEYVYTKTAAKHFSEIVKKGTYKGEITRPYMNSPLTIQEIMQAGKGIPDATFKGGVNWKVPGVFREAQGIWELGINPKTKVIYHFNFKN